MLFLSPNHTPSRLWVYFHMQTIWPHLESEGHGKGPPKHFEAEVCNHETNHEGIGGPNTHISDWHITPSSIPTSSAKHKTMTSKAAKWQWTSLAINSDTTTKAKAHEQWKKVA